MAPLKLKVKPADFIVEEVAALPLSKQGAFGAYLLEKEGQNTVELLERISRKLNLSFADFSYGGRKDRYALTSQYISIRGGKQPDLKEKDYALKFIGYMPRPMGPDLILKNKFTVTVRNLAFAQKAEINTEIEAIKSFGYPNYFDQQRFGSFDPRQGFLAEKVLKGEFNGALKIYLTSIYPTDKKAEKERKGFFFSRWRDWPACLKKAQNPQERTAFSFLAGNPNGFLKLLRQIPAHELSTFISAYQSFLWNEILRRLLKDRIGNSMYACKGLAGDYLFYRNIALADYEYLKGLLIPVPGPKAKAEDARVESIYAEVLADNRIKPPMFNKFKLRQSFFRTFYRSAIVVPQDLAFSFTEDELYPHKARLLLEFSLPRGSFATLLAKRIFIDK